MPAPVMTAAEVTEFWVEHFPQIRPGEDFQVVSIAENEAVVRLCPADRHLRPGGTVSGPSLFTLADVAAYAVLLAHVGPVALMVTVNMSVNFMRRPPPEPLLATCRLLKLGRRLAVIDAAIAPESGGEMVAHASGTYAIPPGG